MVKKQKGTHQILLVLPIQSNFLRNLFTFDIIHDWSEFESLIQIHQLIRVFCFASVLKQQIQFLLNCVHFEHETLDESFQLFVRGVWHFTEIIVISRLTRN